jgi:hypothetical protein
MLSNSIKCKFSDSSSGGGAKVDINLTGTLVTNVGSMQSEASIDYSTIISAGAVLFGVIVSQFFEWRRRRDDEQKEAKKELFNLKVKYYLKLIEDATNWLSYWLDHKEKSEAESAPIMANLRISYLLAELVADNESGSIIKNGYEKITDRHFIEDELIPALRNDLRVGKAPNRKSWWQLWK